MSEALTLVKEPRAQRAAELIATIADRTVQRELELLVAALITERDRARYDRERLRGVLEMLVVCDHAGRWFYRVVGDAVTIAVPDVVRAAVQSLVAGVRGAVPVPRRRR